MPLDDRTPLPPTLAPRKRVLVVDDEPSIRMIARIMLERAGYEVEEAADAREAWNALLLASKPFTAMLLDITLPGRSGLDLLQDIHEAKPELRVILTSGKDEDDYPNHGANAYLAKPFTRDQLVAVVQDVTRAVVI